MAPFNVLDADPASLLAHLLTPSLGERSLPCAVTLLDRFGSLSGVLAAPASEVRRTLGDPAVLCVERLTALHQLVLRVLEDRITARPLTSLTEDLHGYLRAGLAHEPREQFRVLHLDAGHHLISDEIAGMGTIDHAPVYPREVVHRALELGAKSLLLVHNHPSGDPTPSLADIQTTERIAAACAGLDITLLDHLVVGRFGICSFRQKGLPPWSPTPPSARRPGRPRSASASRDREAGGGFAIGLGATI